jgi:aspartate aminotransferase
MLSSIGEDYLFEARGEYQRRRDTAVKALAEIPGVETYTPKGGFYLLAKLPVDDAENFATFMLKEFEYQGATTFVAPAAGFYMNREMGRQEIRIAFVLNEGATKKAIEVIGAGLKAYGAKR